MRGRLLAVAASVAVLTSCSLDRYDDAGTVCTLMGAVPGVSVQVAADVAPISGLELRVCAGGECTDHEVPLTQGSEVGGETCEGDGDDAACVATVTPTATQLGFVTVDLPAGPAQVSGSYRAGGRVVILEQVTVPVEVNYPNGPDCGSDGMSAGLDLDASGLSAG